MREYGVVEGARLSPLGTHVVQQLERGEKADPQALAALMAAATGHDAMEILGLEDSDFEQLCKAWREVNGPLYEPKPTAGGKGTRWADVYATLIAHGHDPDRIGLMPARRVTLFYEAALRRERKGRAERISEVNLGFAGGAKAREAIKSLTKEN